MRQVLYYSLLFPWYLFHTYCPECTSLFLLYILELPSSLTNRIIWAKDKPILQPHLNLHSHDDFSDSFLFLPYLGGRNRGYLNAGSPPPIYVYMRSVGWGSGWLGPPLSSVLANARAGRWDKGQPLHMTTHLTSEAHWSQNLASRRITT